MAASYSEPIERSLADGLGLRTAAGPADVARLAQFNGLIHGPGLAAAIQGLMDHYPGMDGQDLFFVENKDNGQVVSSLMLIPWTLAYEQVDLPVGEMAFVGTRQGYRGRGLVRAQVEAFMERLRGRGCLLSLIQGIPNFYRQFGYEYALPLEGGLTLTGRELPGPPDTVFSFRQATPDDLPALVRLYDLTAGDLGIATRRSTAIWHYLLRHTAGTELACETWLVLDGAGEPAGYFRLPENHFGDELAANEASRMSYAAALAALHRLHAFALERGKPGVRLNLPATCTLMRLARSLGAHDLSTYAWQVHVPDLAVLLRAIGPVLERRIATSPFAGLDQALPLRAFRDSLTLYFQDGKLVEVGSTALAEGGVVFPLQTFIPLLLGYRTIDELRHIYPDVGVPGRWRLLLDTLFPRMPSFVYPSY